MIDEPAGGSEDRPLEGKGVDHLPLPSCWRSTRPGPAAAGKLELGRERLVGVGAPDLEYVVERVEEEIEQVGIEMPAAL
jgi:hypothetical protein